MNTELTMGAIWVCEEHYQELCRLAGYKIPVMLIYNAFQHKCERCERIAEHLVDVPKGDS